MLEITLSEKADNTNKVTCSFISFKNIVQNLLFSVNLQFVSSFQRLFLRIPEISCKLSQMLDQLLKLSLPPLHKK